MRKHLFIGVDALFITNPTNIRYLTGFVGVEDRDAYCLVTQNQFYFFTSSLYLESAKKLRAKVLEISRENPIAKEIARLCEELKIKKLGFEEANLTVAEYNKLKGLHLVPTNNRIEQLRMIKRADEIAHIRLAANLTDQCFKFITRRIRPGVTESRLALEIEGFLRSRGADLAFSPIVAFNEHSFQPHYHERSYDPLRRGSLILLDFGAKINGYCADMTRVVFVGKPKDGWVRAYNTVLQAQNKALGLLRDGVRSGATLDAAAKEVIAEANLPPYPHSLGHNVGLDVHEGPRLSVKKDEKLLPGMVFSVEPAVYIEGTYGIRIEDLVRLTDKGIEILSTSPKEMIIL
ncbi:MAG: peptidase M24, Xaa-Pro aminopeptidase [Microgenomates group bacterium GW2011_GWC1_49_7]|nr:MAG: peptidase M24, Xaa-Pro aminopeptidase [Microgenomates group bacterium GW2011_GWC1_49_7]